MILWRIKEKKKKKKKERKKKKNFPDTLLLSGAMLQFFFFQISDKIFTMQNLQMKGWRIPPSMIVAKENTAWHWNHVIYSLLCFFLMWSLFQCQATYWLAETQKLIQILQKPIQTLLFWNRCSTILVLPTVTNVHGGSLLMLSVQGNTFRRQHF